MSLRTVGVLEPQVDVASYGGWAAFNVSNVME